MAQASLEIRLNCEQVLRLAQQLSDEDKLLLSKRLSAEVKSIKLRNLLNAFKNEKLTIEDVDMVVEDVKRERYGRKQ